MVSVEELKPKVHPQNPNKHPPEQIRILSKIIAKGIRAPIVVSNRSGLITKGHGRLLAAEKLNLKEFPVDFQDYASEADEISDLVADNRIQQYAELDMAGCANLVVSIMDMPSFYFDLTAMSQVDMNLFTDTGHQFISLQTKTTEKPEANPEENEQKRQKGKPSFRCPNCGWEDVD
jgi:hypothetical protein